MPKQVSFLQKLAKKEPDYVNTEYVYPCKVKEVIYKAPLCEKDSHVFSFVQNHLKTIVTPHGYKALTKKSATELVDVLQSLYENGRVLESKDTITIDGKQYMMTMKGIGSTNYCRTTGAINPFNARSGHVQDPIEKKRLKLFPFVDNAGILPLKSAMIEKDISLWLESLDVDTEKVLAIHTLEDLMGPHGEYIPVSQLVKDKVIRGRLDPCIISRLQKTNIRLLDIFMMKEYDKKYLIKPTIKEILRTAKEHRGVEDINSYLCMLIEKIVHNRLTLSQYCHTINGDFWADISRNITCLAEEVDLVTIEKREYINSNPLSFCENYKKQMILLMNGICNFISVIEQEGGYKIDHQLIADSIRKAVKSYIINNEEQLKKLFIHQKRYSRYNYISGSKKKKPNDVTFISFKNTLIKNIFWFISEYTTSLGYTKILKERLSFLED